MHPKLKGGKDNVDLFKGHPQSKNRLYSNSSAFKFFSDYNLRYLPQNYSCILTKGNSTTTWFVKKKPIAQSYLPPSFNAFCNHAITIAIKYPGLSCYNISSSIC